MNETKIVGQALGPHYDAPSERVAAGSIGDDARFHDVLNRYNIGVLQTKSFIEFIDVWGSQRYFAGLLIGNDAARQPAIAPAATPAGWVSVPKVLRQEMDAALDTARGRLSNQALWDEVLAAAPTSPA